MTEPITDADLARVLEHGTPDCQHNWTVTSACPLCLRGRIVFLADAIRSLRASLDAAERERERTQNTLDETVRAMGETIIRVEAQRDELSRNIVALDKSTTDTRVLLVQRAEAAEAKLAGAEQDARRYRWLRGQFRTFSPDMSGQHSYCLASGIMRARGPNIDAAIDAALARDKEG